MTRVGWIRAAVLLAGVAGATALAGCGDDDEFKNDPRPPVTLQLSGAITAAKVSVEPKKLGAGPIVLIVSNLTQEAHTITLDGPSGREVVGPINPGDTGRIQEDMKPGSYEVRAGSDIVQGDEIEPAKLTVGPERASSSDKVLLP
ncbi:MAG TPA: hypothetical protein VF520_01265 [Thermoleophilaceae bacterium]|jgi:hypothetical protein